MYSPQKTAPPLSPARDCSPRRSLPMPTNENRFSSPRKLPTNENRLGHSLLPQSYLRLASVIMFVALLSTASLFTAQDNSRLQYYNNAQVSGESDSPVNDVSHTPAYSILPKVIYSVIGLESSGTQFVSKIIEDALKTTGPYREGSAPCKVACTNTSHQCLVMEQIIKGHKCREKSDVQVQHFSLPWGGSCHQHPNPPVVDVVLPPQCTRDHTDPIEIKECNAMAQSIWGFQLNGKAMIYPTRYHLDIVKTKKWYDAQGVEQIFIIVVRDDKISFAARHGHCNNTELRQQEEDVGTNIIVDAINTYILGDENATDKTYKNWVAKEYQGETIKGTRRRLGALPSKENVVVVSYESLVKLGSTYVKMLYDVLGIKSDIIPHIKNSNEKYLNKTWT